MTTVLQSASVDVHQGNQFDSERQSEVGRLMMDAGEIRQMVKYKQAIAIIGNAPPVRLSFPPYARIANPPLCEREICFHRIDEPGNERPPVVSMTSLGETLSAPGSKWHTLPAANHDSPPIEEAIPEIEDDFLEEMD